MWDISVLYIMYLKPLECITWKVKSERSNNKLFGCSSPVSMYQYPVNLPSTSVIVMISWSLSRCETLTILSALAAIAPEPVSVRASHLPPCVIHIYKCHFQGCSLFTSCHSCLHLCMTFTLYFSHFLEHAMFPPTEKLSPWLCPVTLLFFSIPVYSFPKYLPHLLLVIIWVFPSQDSRPKAPCWSGLYLCCFLLCC